jgi:hypothetical protein
LFANGLIFAGLAKDEKDEDGIRLSANSWLPKVPGFVTGFFVGWAKFLVLPVFGLIGHWKSIRTPNPDGDRTGVVVASVSTLWTFIVAVFLWWFAVLPLIFVASITYHAVR